VPFLLHWLSVRRQGRRRVVGAACSCQLASIPFGFQERSFCLDRAEARREIHRVSHISVRPERQLLPRKRRLILGLHIFTRRLRTWPLLVSTLHLGKVTLRLIYNLRVLFEN